MGGSGSTRWGWTRTKQTVEECVNLDADQIWYILFGYPETVPMHYRLMPSWSLNSTGDRFRIEFVSSEDWGFGKDVTLAVDRMRYGAKGWIRQNVQELRLRTQETAIGVVRHWFICPRCHSKRKSLYCEPYNLRILCRVCHDLTYASSQRDRRLGRALMSLLLPSEISAEERAFCCRYGTSTLLDRDPDHRVRNKRRAQIKFAKRIARTLGRLKT